MRGIRILTLALLAARPLLAQQSEPGWYVETKVTTTRAGRVGNPTPTTNIERAWTSAACSRTEGIIVHGGHHGYRIMRVNPMWSADVVPDLRTVYVMDAKSRSPSQSQMQEAEIAKMKADLIARGAKGMARAPIISDGESILGHNTHRYLTETAADIRIYAGRTTRRAAMRIETWSADDPADVFAAEFSKARPTPVAVTGSVVGGRMVLKQKTEERWLSDVTVFTLREVTAWRREPMPADACRPPADYKVVDVWVDLGRADAMRKELESLRGRTDAASKARQRVLLDSMGRLMGIGTNAPRSLRDNPNATIITSPAKKP